MYRSIVVPLDGSPFAEQAIAPAIAIAERCGAKVTFTRAWDPANYRYTSELTPPFLSPWAQDRLHATDYLTGVASRVRPTTAVAINVALLVGQPVEAINQHLTRTGTDLVVMSTHGLTGWSRAWLGSVADALVRVATVPILLIRPREVPSAAASIGFKCMLLPLDGSAEAEQILPQAAAIGAAGVERFVLLRVEQPMQMPVYPYANTRRTSDIDQAVTDQVVTEARTYLTRMAEWLSVRCPGATMEVDVRIADQPDNAIVNAVRDYQADLVALTTHAQRGVRLLVESVADRVLRATHGSLLVLRPTDQAETGAGVANVPVSKRMSGVVV